MKYLKFIFLGLGFVLLGVILRQTNLQEVWQQITLVSWWGMTVVMMDNSPIINLHGRGSL